MKALGAVLAACVLLAVGCGPDSELVASGKIHKCKLADLATKLQAEPGNVKIQAEIKTVSDDLQAVINTADEGKRAELEQAINEAFAKGCK